MFGNQQPRQLVFCLLALMLLTFELPETLMAQTTGSAVGQPQSPFVGSVPTGQATGQALDLSLKEAFARALQYNLGVVESNQDTRAAHAVRLHNLNALLPDLSARVSG